MNIKTLFLENKTASSLALTFVIGTGLFGYMAWSAWDDYGAATADYSSKASTLDHLSHKEIFPSASNLRKLSQTFTENQNNLQKLRKALQTYQVNAFGSFDKAKTQDQDALRDEVTAVKTIATSSAATLPSSFYLGLDEYENRLPQPEQLPLLSKQLTVLDWLGKKIAEQKGAILADFSRVPIEASKVPSQPGAKPLTIPTTAGTLPYESLGSVRITLRCDQGEFRDLINAISTAPYFLVIEDIKIQNSAGEPPLRDASASADQPPADGTSTVQRLPIIVGRETLNVILKIKMINFPSPPNQPGVSK